MKPDCAEIETLLPWHLAASLSESEAETVARHLEQCERCRSALEQTRQAGALFAVHLPTAVLAGYGLGLPVEDLPRERIEEHLAICASCRDELALVKADRGAPAEATGAVVPIRRPGRRPATGWRPLALAASVVAAAALGFWVGDGRPRAPRPDPAVVLLELAPQEARSRGETADAATSRSTATTLLLTVARAEPFERVRLRARDESGATVWELDGLAPTAHGGYLIHLPAGALPAGAIRLELSGRLAGAEQPIAAYRLDVQP